MLNYKKFSTIISVELYRSMKRSLILDLLPEKTFCKDREKELKFQKEELKKMSGSDSAAMRNMLAHILLDEANEKLRHAKGKISSEQMHALLAKKRIWSYREFLEISQRDQKKLARIARRYQRMRDKYTAKTKKGWKFGIGIGAALAAAGTAAAIYYLKKEKEEKK